MTRPAIVDSHLDIAFNAQLGFDPCLPLAEARARSTPLRDMVTVTLPALEAAGTRIVFGTLFALPHGAPGDIDGPSYATPDEAHAIAAWQTDYYHRLRDTGWIHLVEHASDLAAPAQTGSEAGDDRRVGVVQLMEGADPIRSPQELEWWFERGLRIVGPAWTRTRYCGGTMAPGPLTALGRGLMRELGSVGMALDTSHFSEESFWEAMRLFDGPAIASHSNCRRFVPTDRHLSDEMIRALVDRDGVVGVVLYNRFLDASWAPGDKAGVRLDAVVRHIEHICEIAGDMRHVGIGSDLDGGFGRESIPAEMDSCTDLPLIGAALKHAGWRDDEVAGVLGGNWLRWLEQTLP